MVRWSGNRCRAVLIVLSCAASIPIQSSAAEDSDLKRRVFSEYPAALDRLEHAFVPVSGTAFVEIRNGDSKITKTIEFAFNKDRKKIVEKKINQDGRYDERVYCANPDYAFALKKEAAGGPYLVADFASDPKRMLRQIGVELGFALFPAWRINPWSIVPLEDPLAPISAAIRTSKYNFKSVAEASIDGERAVKIEYSYDRSFDSPETHLICTDRLWVVPAEDWALHRMETDRHNISTGKTREAGIFIEIQYRPERAPMLMPKRVHVRRSEREDDEFEFRDLQFGEIPEGEFTFGYFGLPDLAASGRNGGLSLANWVFIFAFACLGVGLLLRICGDRIGKARNRRRPMTVPPQTGQPLPRSS
jgi:hypothetical protein